MARIKKEGKGVIFNNSALEVFTRTNPVLHVITYGSVIGFFFYLNQQTFKTSLLLFFTGIFTWTFLEYILHRFVFHISYPKFQYMVHGVHHEFPRDKERLLMPPLPGLLAITVLTSIFYLLLWSYTFAFMMGFLSGYLMYTFIHYIVHAWKPVKGLKFLWAHHHKHHNPVFEDKAFGVSSPLWDYVFGTMPPKK